MGGALRPLRVTRSCITDCLTGYPFHSGGTVDFPSEITISLSFTAEHAD